jgi:hypothetical protein
VERRKRRMSRKSGEDKKTLYINALNRTAGVIEDFTIVTQVESFPTPPKSVKLVTASIPYVWDTITADNNTFSIVQTTVPPPPMLTTVVDNFVIPPGNYTGQTLASTVQALINASLVLGQTYIVTYSNTTFQFTFTTSGSSPFQIVFGTAATLLGFAPNSTNPPSPAFSVTSTQLAQLLPDYEIFICSDLVIGSDNGVIIWKGSPPNLSGQTMILARIPINECYSEVLQYRAHEQLPFYTVTQSNFVRQMLAEQPASMRFFLALPSGNPVNMHNYWWTAELVFDFNDA